MKTLGRAGRAALIFQVWMWVFGWGYFGGRQLQQGPQDESRDPFSYNQLKYRPLMSPEAFGWGQFGSSQLKQKHLA